jgi:argininosuccinate lyase
MFAGAKLKRDVIAQRLNDGYLDATTLMEYLIGKGVPQRTAHHLVGSLVAKAMQRGVPLADLTLDDYRAEYEDLDEGLFEVLGAERAVQAFRSYGSTAPDQVALQIQRWKEKLEM